MSSKSYSSHPERPWAWRPTHGDESHGTRHPRGSGGCTPLPKHVDSRPSASSGQALRGNDERELILGCGCRAEAAPRPRGDARFDFAHRPELVEGSHRPHDLLGGHFQSGRSCPSADGHPGTIKVAAVAVVGPRRRLGPGAMRGSTSLTALSLSKGRIAPTICQAAAFKAVGHARRLTGTQKP
jgi:hypothetical protein